MRDRASDCARTRGELGRGVARLCVGEEQRTDIALLVTEAATNVVLHAYVGRGVGSLCLAATISGTPSPLVRRARVLCEHSRSLRMTSAALHRQSLEVVAEIRRTRMRSRRRP